MFAWHAHAEPYLIPAQLFLIMIGMGARLGVRDFALVAKQPGGLVLAVVVHWLLVPTVAVLLARVLGLTPGWTVGLLLVAAAPAAAWSNLFTFLGRGNVALSICSTAITTIGCVVVAPTMLRVLATSHLPATFSLPTDRILVEMVAYLLAPLLFGMVVLRVWPARAETVSRWCIRISIVLLSALFVGALGSGRIKVEAYGWGPPLIIIAFGTLLALTTLLACTLLGRRREDTITLTIQSAMRNMGVALLMVRFFFPDQPEQAHVLYTVLFYAGAAGWFAVPTVLVGRYGYRQKVSSAGT